MEKIPSQCKYFLHGACSKGNGCKFVHDLNAKKDNVCKFHLKGSCSYGSSCRYDHVRLSVRPIKPAFHDVKKVRPIKPAFHDVKKTVQSTSNLIVLGKKEKSDVIEEKFNDDWANAAVFIPGKKFYSSDDDHEKKPFTYSSVVSFNLEEYHTTNIEEEEQRNTYDGDIGSLLCPFAAVRECPYAGSCVYIHGDRCDLCNLQCLHPTNQQQRKFHRDQCIMYHEREMERAFSAQRSSGVVCSICLDVVMEKADSSQRLFGLLENCNHPFCLSCIRDWRSSSHQEKTVVRTCPLCLFRTCPLCRVLSWYVTPSEYWVNDAEEKKVIIENYKTYLNTKPCHNFDYGRGSCQFGTSCFYKHVYPDGTLDDRNKPSIRHYEDAEGNSMPVKATRLNEFIEARDE